MDSIRASAAIRNHVATHDALRVFNDLGGLSSRDFEALSNQLEVMD